MDWNRPQRLEKSGLIESYDDRDNDSIATEPDVVIDDDETPTVARVWPKNSLLWIKMTHNQSSVNQLLNTEI